MIEYLDITSIPRTGKIGRTSAMAWAEAPSRAKRRAGAGDILVSTVRPYLRSFARLRRPPANLVVSTGFAVIRAATSADGEFLYQHILSPRFVQHLLPRMIGSNYPAVGATDVRDSPLLLPPLPEQRKIAEILSSVDSAIEKTEAVIEQVRRAKQGLARELLTRGLPGRHTRLKQTEVGEIPESWEVVRLGEIAQFSSGSSISVARLTSKSAQCPVPAYGGNGIAGFTDQALIAERTVAVGRVGQKCGVVYLTEGPAWITDNALYPRQLLRDVDIAFLALLLERAQLNEVRNRNDLPLVTQAIVHAVRIAWPPDVWEQREIVQIISRVDDVIQQEVAALEQMRHVKNALMHALLTGQVRVRVDDANDALVGAQHAAPLHEAPHQEET